MLHVYYGTGKGKTSAAVGLAIRAAGAGKKVYYGAFLKSQVQDSSEFNILKKLITLEVYSNQQHPMFARQYNTSTLKEI